MEYMEELAALVGCKPNLLKTALIDPSLTNRLIFNGLVPYQFRLEGPQPWAGAREAIMGLEERTVENTRTRRVEGRKGKRKPGNRLRKALFVWF